MASISKPRSGKDGTLSWYVHFRYNGRQTSEPFSDERRALLFRDEINATAPYPGGPTNPTEVLERHGIIKAAVAGPTVAAWVERHIKDCGADDKSKTKYRQILHNDIAPTFGDMRLRKLTFTEIFEWIEYMRDNGMRINPKDKGNSPKTIRNKYAVLSGALHYAVKKGQIPSHPCAQEEDFLPDVKRARKRILRVEEFNQLRDAFNNEEMRLFVQFLVVSGCRFNEVTALPPGEVDMNAGQVHIGQAWSWIPPAARSKTNPQSYRLKDPKTNTSIRDIEMPVEMLERLKDAGMLDPGREFVFLNEAGGPIRRTTFKNVWDAAVIRSGLTGRKPKVKDLRATFASVEIARGVEQPVVQNHLGHSDPGTTAKWYVEMDSRKARAAADDRGSFWFA